MKGRREIRSPSPDATPGLDLPDEFWEKAVWEPPVAKTPISMRVDPDIIEFFKADGAGHLSRMHAVLRAYVDAHRDRA